VTEEAGGGNGARRDDADRDEDGAIARSIGDGDFEARAFGIMIAAAEGDSAAGEVFADGDFFLEAALPDAGKDAGLYARAVAPGLKFVVHGKLQLTGRAVVGTAFASFDPDRRGLAVFAQTRDAPARLKRFQLELIQVANLAAQTEAALHQEAGQGIGRMRRVREVDVPEIDAQIKNGDGVEEAVRIVIDFGDDARVSRLPVIGTALAAEENFLPGKQFFRQPEYAAVAADEERFRLVGEGRSSGAVPSHLNREAQADPVALADTFRARGHG